MAKQSLSQIPVVFNGASFLMDVADGKMMSLNTIYAAAGSPAFREPSRWVTNDDVVRFIDEMCNTYNTDRKGIIKVTRGKGGGTWAHWKIATRYAAYLDPTLEIAILDVFRERVQEEIDPGKAITRGIEGYKRQGRSNRWIDSRLRTSAGWNALTDTLKTHDVVKQGYAKTADSINVPIIKMTAKEFKQEKGLKKHEGTRNGLDAISLDMIALAQSLSEKKIVDDDVRGNNDCAKTCFEIATRVAALRS